MADRTGFFKQCSEVNLHNSVTTLMTVWYEVIIDIGSAVAELTQSCQIRQRLKDYALWMEENKKPGECEAARQQLEMTGHGSDCISPDWTGLCPHTLPITDIAALCGWAHLVLLGESPLIVITASVCGRSSVVLRRPSQSSSPWASLTHAGFLGRVRGGRGAEGGRKGQQRSFSCNIFEKTACPTHWSCSVLWHLD